MTEPSEGIMSRIMKLLALANDEGTTPAERALAEENAERLMAKHMVDRFQAEQKAKAMGNTVRKPIQESWEVNMTAWQKKGEDSYEVMNEFQGQIIDMMSYVLQHCGIRVNRNYGWRKVKVNEGTEHERLRDDTSVRVYKIVGFPEDIAYAERIWFNVFRTFVSNVNPQWEIDQSVEWNAYNFASAGTSWKQMVLLAEAAGDTRVEKPWRYQGEDKKAPFYSSFNAGALIDPGNEAWGRSIHKLKRACKKYCTDQGVEYPYAGGAKLRVASRNSFARSYRATIISRLDEIRQKAKDGADHVDAGQFALAVRDTAERVDEEFYRLFPEFDPEVRRKMQEAAAFERAVAWAVLSPEEQAKVLREEAAEARAWARSAGRARRSYRAVRNSPDQYDAAAWQRGRTAAQSVNLRNDAEVRTDKKKEIN